jgi:predicted DNA-binding transcriptional regulator YafY
MKSIKQLLTEAANQRDVIDCIKNNKEAMIYYYGDKTIRRGWRRIEPYVLGISKAGNLVVRAWQINGASDTKLGRLSDPLTKIPGWRLFRLDKISTWNVIEDKFNTSIEHMSANRKKYNYNDKDMIRIIRAIKPKKTEKIIN